VLAHTGAELQALYSLADRFGDAWVSSGPDPSDALSSPQSESFPYPMGTNAIFRRDRLVEVGGYDEEFAYYLDETDVCRRLLDRGYRIATLDRGWVFHKFLPSFLRMDTKAVRQRYPILKSKAYFALRHGR